MAKQLGKTMTFVYGDSDSQSIHLGQHRSLTYNTTLAFNEFILHHKGIDQNDKMSAFGTTYHLLWTFKGLPEKYTGQLREMTKEEMKVALGIEINNIIAEGDIHHG